MMGALHGNVGRTGERSAKGQRKQILWHVRTGRKSRAAAGHDLIAFLKTLSERSCVKCRGGEKPKAGFDLSSRDALLKGGQSGEPPIIPGRSADRPLLAFVTDKVEDLEMPPLNRREKYPSLTSNEVAVIRAWIDAGAEWDTVP